MLSGKVGGKRDGEMREKEKGEGGRGRPRRAENLQWREAPSKSIHPSTRKIKRRKMHLQLHLVLQDPVGYSIILNAMYRVFESVKGYVA